MRKYQKVEKAEVVSPEGHDRIAKTLRKQGATSMQDLGEAERQRLLDELEEEEEE